MIKLPKQSQYPKRFYYADECYKLIFKKGFKHYGETDPNKKTITIKSGLSPRALLATYIHEVCHVIEFEAPLNLKHKMIYKLEAAILEILIDNFL